MTTEERYRINEINFKILCNIKYNYRNDPKDVINYIRSLSIFMNFDTVTILKLTTSINEKRFETLKHEKIHWLYAQGLSKTAIHSLTGTSRTTINNYLEIPIFPRFEREYREILDKFMTQYERFNPMNINSIVEWGCENV